MDRAVFYRSVGPTLAWFDHDDAAATLNERGSVTLPANVQYVWPHPSRRTLYVVSSDGASGNSPQRGSTHRASAFRIDPATGALTPHGPERVLPVRPIHASVDGRGRYLLTAYNNPSQVTVHSILPDGSLGEAVVQAATLDAGIFAHQILTTPDNTHAILVARGNHAENGRPEDPGALKTLAFNDGVLANAGSVAPGGGFGFGPRHLDFHPTRPWVYVSVERQSELHVYELCKDGTLSSAPLFMASSLVDRSSRSVPQMAGAIHVHPNGRFVYQTNRNSATMDAGGGRRVLAGGENNIAVFAIDGKTGAPALIQNAAAHANHLRTFSIAPGGRLLVAAGIQPIDVREAGRIATLPAALVLYRIGTDGRLTFARKYDVDPGAPAQWWCGFITLPAT